ncbi:MAG TPA: IS1182 family transposase [Desulfobacteraceae bacterium]|nr:IS1182 family transposase [Desulfobacteraceae bacterium]
MEPRFKDCDRDTLFLMPPSVNDWVPENHLSRFVVEIVNRLDLSPIINAYAGRGSDAYPPSMMVALLFYAYATGVFSSRKIERSTYDSVAFRYIAANTHPDHDTIASFRKRFLKELKALFGQILLIAHEMGVLKLGSVSLDGTKIKANASKHHALSWDYARKLEKQLKDEIKELLRKATQADKEDLPEGMSIPEELARRESRLKAIAAAKTQIEQRAAERFAKEQQAYEEKVSARKAKEKEAGKKSKGRTPVSPQPGPKNKDQVNLTDSDSRIMPSQGGGFEQAYNGQAAVDIDSMLIVENHITQQSNDKLEVTPALENFSRLPDKLGTVEKLLADTGYFSAGNVEKCETDHIVPYIAGSRQRHNAPLMDRFTEPEPLTGPADPVTEMTHRLKTIAGKAIYAKRKCTVEPAFGIIKAVMGFRQFLMRGLDQIAGEWNLVCMAYNIKRLHVLSSP